MDKTITTALLIVISMVMALMLFNAAYPAIVQGGDAIANMSSRADERMKSQVALVHAIGELGAGGLWQDTNGDGQFEVFAWVKNVGANRIIAIERTDVFFGREGSFVRIPYQAEAMAATHTGITSSRTPGWVPTATIRITIHYQAPLGSGRYFLKVITPAGVSDEYFFGM
jgi:hypothetical protein